MGGRTHSVAVAVTFLFVLAHTTNVASEPSSDPNEWKPDRDLVARADSLAAMFTIPKEFGPISAYSRFYWGTVVGGRKVVEGIFIAPSVAKTIGRNSPELVQIVPESSAPGIADGGCNIVYFQFDVESDKVNDVHCNFELPVPPPPPQH